MHGLVLSNQCQTPISLALQFWWEAGIFGYSVASVTVARYLRIFIDANIFGKYVPWCIFYATMHERKFLLLDNKFVSRDLKWNLDDRTTNGEKIKRNLCCGSIWSICSGYWRKRFKWYVMALFFLSVSHFFLTIFLIASITSFVVKGLAFCQKSNLTLCQIFDSEVI